MTERVALTGATGFLGSNLLTALAKSEFPIRALTRRNKTNSGFVTWINGDLNNQAALDELVKGCTSVIHCAGAVRGNSLEDFLEVNLRGTENLLAAIRKNISHGQDSCSFHQSPPDTRTTPGMRAANQWLRRC